MGFSSLDDLISELTAQGKFWRGDFSILPTGIGTVVAGRWYDLTLFPGYPNQYIHGNMVYNYDFQGGTGGWTIGSANWAWTPATHLMTRTANADVSTVSQNTECVQGVTYSVVYTVARSAGGVTISLGGTNGTPRTSAGTFRESIACGATANAPLVITPDATYAGTVDVIGVTRDLGFTPYQDDGVGREAGIWHGGDVDPDTKHILNIGGVVNTAAGAPAVLQIVDRLGVYPRIRTDLATTQTLNNTLPLPRYADGKGVRAYFQLNAVNGANAANFVMSYTNTVPASGRGLGAIVSHTASGIVGHISHSGVAAGNYGPFLPLQAGDQGIKSVESCQFTAASASAGFVDLVLCRPLCTLPITAAFYMSERDLLSQLPSLPQVEDGAVLGVIIFTGAVMTAVCQYQGYIEFGWG
jgi:hypothetical protein